MFYKLKSRNNKVPNRNKVNMTMAKISYTSIKITH